MVMFLPGSAFGLSEFDFSNPGLPVEFPLRLVSLTWKFVDRSYVVVIKSPQIPFESSICLSLKLVLFPLLILFRKKKST